MLKSKLWLFLWVLGGIFWLTPELSAQNGDGKELTEVTVEIIQEKVKQAEEIGLEEEKKKKLLEMYQEASNQLQIVQGWENSSKEFNTAARNAPEMLNAIKDALAQKGEILDKASVTDLTISQLEQLLSQAEANSQVAMKESENLQQEAKVRAERRTKIPSLIASARQKLEELRLSQNLTTEEEERVEFTNARRLAWLASEKAILAEIKSYEDEIASYDARVNLLVARRDRAAQKTTQAQEKIKALREFINQRRQMEAEKAAQKAREELLAAVKAHPIVQSLVEENAELAELRSGSKGLVSKITKVSQEHDQINEKLAKLKEDFRVVQEKVKAIGITNAIGLLLRKKRGELPDTNDYRQRITARYYEIPEVQLKLMEFEELRILFSNMEEKAQEILSSLDSSLPEKQEQEIAKAVREQLETKQNYLEELVKDYNLYFIKLVDLDGKEQQIVAEVEAYFSFIEEHIFWIRSTNMLNATYLRKGKEALFWFFNSHNWFGFYQVLLLDMQSVPPLFAFFILLLTILLGFRKSFYRKIRLSGEKIAQIKTDSIRHTIEATLCSVALSLPFPLLTWFISWRIFQYSASSEFTLAISYGFSAVTVVSFILIFVRMICLENGLGQKHFKWNSEIVKTIHKQLLWALLIGLPIVFVVTTLRGQTNDAWRDSFGRFVFIAGMLILPFLSYPILSLLRKSLKETASSDKNQWLARIGYVAYPLALSLPVGLATLTMVGYFYTSVQLTLRFWYTLLFVVIVELIYFFLMRWLYFFRRTIGIMKFKLQQAELEKTEKTSESTAQVDDSEEDLSSIMNQARHFLINFSMIAVLVGVWLIWSDVLPALKIFYQVDLWSSAFQETKEFIGANGAITFEKVDQKVVITLGDLLLSLLLLFVTMIASKDIPGILEVSVLQRWSTDKGVRFAVVTLARYLILLIGFLIAFQNIGVDWSKLQWLAAGFSVGLGFGLQEIFANLISGLIILFERPIRVGDTVTIGEISGTVTRIQIRATTIMDWDRKELIVPNKEFVTGRLVNWSLSDPTLRIVIPVGVAYGSDTELVRNTLVEVAQKSTEVMKDPAPSSVFKKFGDSALIFDVRVFIPTIDCYIRVLHFMHTEIDKAFRQAGIVIAFPQQDLHIRTINGVDVSLSKNQATCEEG